MNISLLDIWYFLINFNLLGLIPILVAGIFAYVFTFDSTDDYYDVNEYKESSLFQVVLFVFYFSFNYSFLFVILEIWLNWIDMLYPQIIVDTLNEWAENEWAD